MDKQTKIQGKNFIKLYPELHNAYKFTMIFRGIYGHSKSVEDAKRRIIEWYDKVNVCGLIWFTMNIAKTKSSI